MLVHGIVVDVDPQWTKASFKFGMTAEQEAVRCSYQHQQKDDEDKASVGSAGRRGRVVLPACRIALTDRYLRDGCLLCAASVNARGGHRSRTCLVIDHARRDAASLCPALAALGPG